jgi:hypothetical protein
MRIGRLPDVWEPRCFGLRVGPRVLPATLGQPSWSIVNGSESLMVPVRSTAAGLGNGV